MMENAATMKIDEMASYITGISDQIWEYAELSLKEFKSAELYIEALKDNGFEVTENLAGIKTCFKGSYGKGHPYIGILAEFDALSGLSQKKGMTVKEELIENGSGHGCGHNMLGAGSFGAALGLKKYLDETGKPGTVIFYGCPGEEGGAGKAFMAREESWKELDAALTWHPGTCNQVSTGSTMSCIQKQYIFKGIASHAAGAPENGRSALDAVELMNIGVQFLREHMGKKASIHYAITDAGGASPNVVQPHAKVLYMIREHLITDALALEKRVDRIAQAAAMMTDTEMSIQFIDGCANVVPNKVLEENYWNAMQETDAPSYTTKEIEFAEGIMKSYESDCIGISEYEDDEEMYSYMAEHTENCTKAINDFLVPYHFTTKMMAGSTDVGDVSWQVPTAQFNTACFAAYSPGHSWQNVSVGATSIGHKGLIYAAKIIANAAIRLYEDPSIIEKAKEEHAKRTVTGYQCPIPEDAVPVAID